MSIPVKRPVQGRSSLGAVAGRSMCMKLSGMGRQETFRPEESVCQAEYSGSAYRRSVV